MTGVAVRINSRDLCRDLPTAGEIHLRFVVGTEKSVDFPTNQLNGPAFKRCSAAVGLTSVAAAPLLHESALLARHSSSTTPGSSSCLDSTEHGECYVDSVSVESIHEYSGIVQLLSESR